MQVSAALATPIPDGTAPAEIVYIPEGKSTLTPFVDGKPKKITVNVTAENGEAITAKLNSDLKRRSEANVRPWLDFDHKGGVSAGNPKSFRYDKGRGIILAVDWSNAGKTAIEGRDFSYVSPTFMLGENGLPDGLPVRGPVLSLVNEPAFRDIPRIAAKDGTPEKPEATPTMSKLIFAALAISAAADNAETEAVKAIDALKVEATDAKTKAADLEKERDELQEKITNIEAKAGEDRKARAKDLIEAAQADGRIAPKDEETANEFREKIEAGDAFAEKILAKLPKQHSDITAPVVTAGSSTPKGSARVEAAQAKARAELGESAGFSQVWARATEIDPQAFEA